MATFRVEGITLKTSSYSDTDWTQQCVGVGSDCTCHMGVADSVAQDRVLSFPNGEFAAFLAGLDEF